MLIKENLRKYERRPFIKPLRYSVVVLDFKELQRINNISVTVDISKEGIGILTDYPLEEGHILTFKNDLKINDKPIKTAIVKWTGMVDNRYRVGLRFI